MSIIQGGGGKSGGGGGGAVEADDTLRSVQHAKIIDVICEGEIEGLDTGDGRSIFLDDTPITSVANGLSSPNFKDVRYKTTTGTQTQSVMEGFEAGVEAETTVGLIVSIASGPITKDVENTDINRLRVTIGVPRLTQTDTSNGSINGSSVQYKLSLQIDSGSYTDLYAGFQSVPLSIIANTTTTLAQTTIINGSIRLSQYNNEAALATILVEYKSTGSGTWLSLVEKNYVVPGYWPGTVDYDGSGGIIEDAFSKNSLAEDSYDVRVTLVSGVGVTLEMTSCNCTIPSTIVTLTGKTTARYQQSHEILLPGTATTKYSIRVTRLTADPSSEATINQIYWDSYTSILDTKLNYPNTALVGIQIDSSQFKSIPTRGYLVKLRKIPIPSNYNPLTRVYTGIWDGSFYTAWSDNPAWCFYDLVTNTRFGLGEFIPSSWINKAQLYTIAQYCDELVPTGFGSSTEPRYTCNLYIQSQEEAFKVVQNMASIFRAMIYWLGGTLTPVADKPEGVWAQFTNADVEEGVFNYQGSANRARHTVALVTWNDPDNRYKQRIEYVEDSEGITRYGVNQLETIAVGCTSRGQAHRLGKWLLYSERLETEIISFKTSLKGISLLPGKIINTFDQFRAGARNAGRCLSSTTNSITIDAPITLTSELASVDIESPDGTIITKSLTNSLGSHSILTWAEPTNSILTGTAQAGSSSSLTLDSSAEETPDIYTGNTLYISSGTGAGQERNVSGSGKNHITHSEDLRNTVEAGETRLWGQYTDADVGVALVSAADAKGRVRDISKLNCSTTGSTQRQTAHVCADFEDNKIVVHAVSAQAIEVPALSILGRSKATNYPYVTFNLLTGAVVGSYSSGGESAVDYGITDDGNGWYRCWAVFDTKSGSGTASLVLQLKDTSNVHYSGAIGDGLLLDRVKSEVGSVPTEYNRTVGTAAVGAIIDGLWSENLITYSEDLRNTTEAGESRPWFQYVDGDTQVTQVTALNSDGLQQSISKLNCATTGAVQRQAAYSLAGYPADSIYLFAVDALAMEVPVISLTWGSKVPNYPSVGFNLLTGAVTGSYANGGESALDYGMIDKGDGWYRCWAVFDTKSGASNPVMNLIMKTAALGNYSGAIGDGLLLNRVQLQPGYILGDYFKTEGAAINLPDATSVYNIGESPIINGAIWMVSQPDLVPETWRVLSITEEMDNAYVINAVSHNPSKFDYIEQDLKLISLPTSIYSDVNTVNAVTISSENVTDSIYKLSSNSVATRIHISWTPSIGA